MPTGLDAVTTGTTEEPGCGAAAILDSADALSAVSRTTEVHVVCALVEVEAVFDEEDS